MAVAGFVYLIGTIEGCHKIGMSNDPEVRIKALSQPGSYLRVVHSIATSDMRWLERVLHAAYDHVRVGGEWFRLSPDNVAALSTIIAADGPCDLPGYLAEHALARFRITRRPAFITTRRQSVLRIDDAQAELIPRLSDAIAAKQGLSVSVSDLFRMGLLRLENEYLPAPVPPPAAPPVRGRGRKA